MQQAFKVVFGLLFLAVAAVIIWRVPINGWGSLVWVLGGFAMTIIRSPHEKANKANTITESRQTATENVLLGLVLLGGSFGPALHLATGVLSVANYSAPITVPIAGVVLNVIGTWLFWRSHADLGRNWSVTLEIRQEHTLIEHGIYQRIRHPMYTAIFFVFAAQALLLQNWIVGPSGLIAFWLMYLIRVPREEAMMQHRFGQQYAEYSARTGRLWPLFRQ
ncbi:MAG: protein-S-isoprenylcysteine O-methyltransferase [Pseudomonadota bacterium]